MDFLIGYYNYLVVIFLMMLGLYVVVSRGNMVKTLVGLSVFQTSVFIFYISLARVRGGTAPILVEGEAALDVVYSSPLPHVLILTAIVVSISTTALGLALVVRIKEAYGTIEEDEIDDIEHAEEVGVPDIRWS